LDSCETAGNGNATFALVKSQRLMHGFISAESCVSVGMLLMNQAIAEEEPITFLAVGLVEEHAIARRQRLTTKFRKVTN
jgi:hypothetical protein